MTENKPSTRIGLVAFAIAAELLFLVCFFSLELPNSGPPGARASRLDVFQLAVGWLNQPVPFATALDEIVQVEWFPHRLRTVLFALLILAASTGLGGLLFRFAALGQEMNVDTRGMVSESQAGDRLTWSEQLVFSYGLGASGLSLVTLGLGWAGWLHRPSVLAGLACLASLAVIQEVRRCFTRSGMTLNANKPIQSHSNALHDKLGNVWWMFRVACSVAIVLFLVISVLGSMLPATDFDVREYHLQVPKEFFQAGRIQFLPHNVYGNMPFGSEMLHLLGMIVAGDWWWGALVGQVVLTAFAPMTAIGIAGIARRLFDAKAGWMAAVIYLTTPWVYRISIIPYTENAVNFFLVASSFAMLCACQQVESSRAIRLWCIAGAFAGSAAACKYPALISTVLPLGLAASILPLLLRNSRQPGLSPLARSVRFVLAFAAGGAVTFGPWLFKNYVTTGNPVYPLLYRVFDGRNWTEQKNDKWEWGHRVSLLCALGLQRPPDGRAYNRADPQTNLSVRQLKENVLDVTAQADWQSPLVFGFAPMAFLWAGRRRQAAVLWLFVTFLFLQWWLMTHRLDRFWLPVLPIASVLAGAGVTWNETTVWKWAASLIVAVCVFFNFSFCVTPLCGDNRYAARLDSRYDPIDFTVNWMNSNLPTDAKVLAVGSADLFHMDRPVVYNTVFDDCIFEEWVRDREQAADNLVRHGITHVYVNWQEIRRYRQPGSYGYTDFVQPAVFQELMQAGVMRRVQAFGEIVDTSEGAREKRPAGELFVVTARP